jgi:hypothetical protein
VKINALSSKAYNLGLQILDLACQLIIGGLKGFVLLLQLLYRVL